MRRGFGPGPAATAWLAVLIASAALAGCVETGPDGALEAQAEEQTTSKDHPVCSTVGGLVLLAQTVPSATRIPCVRSLPPGWIFGERTLESGLGRISLDSDLAGVGAVQILLTSRCDTSGATSDPALAPDEAGTDKYIRVLQPDPRSGVRADTYFVFDGGCVTYRFDFAAGTPGGTALELAEQFSFVDRSDVAAFVARETGGQRLCGAGVDCVG